VPLAKSLDQVFGCATSECRHAAQGFVEEQAITLGHARQGSQPFVPREQFLNERWRFEAVGAAERAPLDAVGAGLEPHERLAVIEQWQGLQAVATEFGDRFGVARCVSHDGQVVR